MFENLTVIQFVDSSAILNKPKRAPQAPSIKRHHKAAGATKVGGSRLREPKPDITDHVANFGS